MKKLTSVCLLFVLSFCSNSFAQDLPMIASQSKLHSYAIENAAYVTCFVGSYIGTGEEASDVVEVKTPTIAGILEAIESLNIAYEVINPNDPLFATISVRSSSHDLLLTKSTTFKVEVDSGGNYVAPVRLVRFGELALPEYLIIRIPVEPSDVLKSVQVFELANDGSTLYSHTLSVDGSGFYFPRHLAGKNAIIVAQFEHGLEKSFPYRLAWSTKDGEEIKSLKFPFVQKVSVRGVISIKDDDVWEKAHTANRVGNNVLVELTSSKNQELVINFFVEDSVIKDPQSSPRRQYPDVNLFTGIWVKKLGTDKWVSFPISESYGSRLPGARLILNFGVGVYHIIPIFQPEHLIEPQPTHDFDGHGRG